MARISILARFLVITTCLMLVATTANARIFELSSTIQKQHWSDGDIEKEFSRYEFSGLNFRTEKNLDEATFVILSGFAAVGKYWRDLDNPPADKAAPAFARRKQLAEAYRTARPLRISVLAEKILLIRTERIGEWDCDVRLGCYPKGFVVGLGPVDAETAAAICEWQRRNEKFCRVYRR